MRIRQLPSCASNKCRKNLPTTPTLYPFKVSPTFFPGDSTESVNHFLRSFKNYANHMGWTKEKRLRSVPIFLTKSAIRSALVQRSNRHRNPGHVRTILPCFQIPLPNGSKQNLRAHTAFRQIIQYPDTKALDSYLQRLMLSADEHNIGIEAKNQTIFSEGY